jgi:zinc finger HIT domain-containing protein 1
MKLPHLKISSYKHRTMNNFGVIELATAKTTRVPGWAYVPDTGINLSAGALQPANRKRAARNQPNVSLSDLSARQEAKIRKELEALDRDTLSQRDANIPLPQKAGRGTLYSPSKGQRPGVFADQVGRHSAEQT